MPHDGNWSSGTKIPEMKMSGNLMSKESVMGVDGSSVGGAAINIPIAEKHHAARRIETIRIIPCIRERPRINEMKTVIIVMLKPKRIEAIISPRTIASTVIGHEMSRSRVPCLPSQEKIAGDNAVDVKSRVTPTRPGNRKVSGSCLFPAKKARNRKMGMRMPKISTEFFA